MDLLQYNSQIKRFHIGDIMIQAGDLSAGVLYILLQGSALAHTDARPNKKTQFITYKTGDFFGEAALFFGQIPTMSVVATEEVVALVIDREYAGKFFGAYPEAAIDFVGELCRRIGSSPPLPPALANPETAQPQVPSPPSAPAKPAALHSPQPIVASSLFPEGHAHHELAITNADKEYLFTKNFTCPICSHSFKRLAVKTSKLISEHTDSDLRVHYVGIEPLYYDVITCPHCWYSALTEMFKDGVSSKAKLDQLIKPYKEQLPLQLGEDLDSLTVFAGYYLAITCAPKCFRKYDAILGKLWIKLSRLYDDCQNEKMTLYTTEQALKGYMGAYEKSDMPPKQNQQLFYIIGELSLRLNDLPNARRFFFQAKTYRDGSPVLKRQAEDRIEYLRTLTPMEQD